MPVSGNVSDLASWQPENIRAAATAEKIMVFLHMISIISSFLRPVSVQRVGPVKIEFDVSRPVVFLFAQEVAVFVSLARQVLDIEISLFADIADIGRFGTVKTVLISNILDEYEEKVDDRIFRYVYAETQKELTAKLRQSIEAYQGVELTEESRMTLGQWLDQWLENMTGTIRPVTMKRYEGTVARHIKPYLGEKIISQVTGKDIQKLYDTTILGGC